MSELTYDVDCHEALLHTLKAALKQGKTAWQIFIDRPFSLGFMVLLHDAGKFVFKRMRVNKHEMAESASLETQALK